LKNSEGFINNIIEAVEKGFICPYWLFEYKKDKEYEMFLELWQNDLRYEKIRKQNDLLKVEKEKRAKFEYKVYLPERYDENKKYPLFIAMHGDGENMKLLIKDWKAENFLSRGYIVAYVQSAQVYNNNGYSWINNFDITRRDIKTFYQEMREKYFINEKGEIFGGFSGGAIAGIDILMEVISIKGLIAICPERKPKSVNIENIEKAMHRKAKVVFMEGEKSLPMKYEEEMLNMFREAGLPCEYYINKGLAHEIPKNLDEKLDEILGFIFA
jgi:predicted esterase